MLTGAEQQRRLVDEDGARCRLVRAGDPDLLDGRLGPLTARSASGPRVARSWESALTTFVLKAYGPLFNPPTAWSGSSARSYRSWKEHRIEATHLGVRGACDLCVLGPLVCRGGAYPWRRGACGAGRGASARASKHGGSEEVPRPGFAPDAAVAGYRSQRPAERRFALRCAGTPDLQRDHVFGDWN